MADYCCPTVVQEVIPVADMTPLERLVLTQIFDSDGDGDGLSFFAETEPCDPVYLPVDEFKAALAASAGVDSALSTHAAALLANLDSAETDVEIDRDAITYEDILQDVVRRSPTLDYIAVVAAFTCSKMRSDGFGGMAMLITADAVKSKSTNDILDDFLAETEARTPRPAP